jgi:hypothetical protein
MAANDTLPEDIKHCPNCKGRNLWVCEAMGHYWQWIQCDDCDWKSEMVSIPESDRAASDADVSAEHKRRGTLAR